MCLLCNDIGKILAIERIHIFYSVRAHDHIPIIGKKTRRKREKKPSKAYRKKRLSQRMFINKQKSHQIIAQKKGKRKQEINLHSNDLILHA